MIDLLNALLTSVNNGLIFIGDFFITGVYDILVWFSALVIEKATLALLDFAIWSLPFAWDIAQQIIRDLDLSSLLHDAWSSLDSTMMGVATVLRIPEAVNLLISASITKYVLRFIPFL